MLPGFGFGVALLSLVVGGLLGFRVLGFRGSGILGLGFGLRLGVGWGHGKDPLGVGDWAEEVGCGKPRIL